MTEYNKLCQSDEYNSNTSSQQKRFRIWNKEIKEKEFEDFKTPEKELDLKHKTWKDAWKGADISKFKDLKGFDKEIFEKITGLKIEKEKQASVELIKSLFEKLQKLLK